MGTLFSPRVRHFQTIRLALAARQVRLRFAGAWSKNVLKHSFLLLILISFLCTTVLAAQTSTHINLHPLTFWSLYKWYVIVALATFLLQAFLIVRLWISRSHRRQAEIESRRQASLAHAERKRLD